MITIKDLLNKIKWDEKEDENDYTLTYIDLGKEKEIKYSDIKKIEGNFMKIIQDEVWVEVPTHRIRKVKKTGETIWKRKK